MKTTVVLSALLVLAACASGSTRGGSPAQVDTPAGAHDLPGAAAAEYASGDALIRAMHDRYAGRWYRTMTFRQENTGTSPDGKVEHSTWLEAMRNPGELRIDFLPLTDGKGMLFARDSQYVVDGGRVVRSAPLIHPLALLGFDVYAQPADTTIARLRRLGIDLSTIRRDEWQGRPAWVVGAAAGDTRTKQFWIDAERLVFVRMLQPTRAGGVSDTRFDAYYAAGDAWVAPRVEFLVDGKQTWLEEYHDIRLDVPLDDALFDSAAWSTVRHWSADVGRGGR